MKPASMRPGSGWRDRRPRGARRAERAGGRPRRGDPARPRRALLLPPPVRRGPHVQGRARPVASTSSRPAWVPPSSATGWPTSTRAAPECSRTAATSCPTTCWWRSAHGLSAEPADGALHPQAGRPGRACRSPARPRVGQRAPGGLRRPERGGVAGGRLRAGLRRSPRRPEAEVDDRHAEERPLAALGAAASEVVADELAKARIEVVTGVDVRDRTASGSEGGMDAFSSVIARPTRRGAARGRQIAGPAPGARGQAGRGPRPLCLPRAHGPAVAGLPHDERGFLAVDAHSRVAGVEQVFAAGDATALPLKHSTLAAAQATAAAHAIAAQAAPTWRPRPGRAPSTAS